MTLTVLVFVFLSSMTYFERTVNGSGISDIVGKMASSLKSSARTVEVGSIEVVRFEVVMVEGQDVLFLYGG